MTTFSTFLSDHRIDPAETTLVGTLKYVLIPEKEHCRGKDAQVFKSSLWAFHMERNGQPIEGAAFAVKEWEVANERPTWASVGDSESLMIKESNALLRERPSWSGEVAPHGVDLKDVNALVNVWVDGHATLTGERHQLAFEVVGAGVKMVDSILEASSQLRINLALLLDFQEKTLREEDAWIDSLMDETPQTLELLMQRRYERDCLSHEFRTHPCDRGLYQSLRNDFIQGRWAMAMEFSPFYCWYWRNHAEFGASVSPSREQEMRRALTAWAGAADCALDAHWIAEKAKLYTRNFKVHPSFQGRVEAIFKEMIGTEGGTLRAGLATPA